MHLPTHGSQGATTGRSAGSPRPGSACWRLVSCCSRVAGGEVMLVVGAIPADNDRVLRVIARDEGSERGDGRTGTWTLSPRSHPSSSSTSARSGKLCHRRLSSVSYNHSCSTRHLCYCSPSFRLAGLPHLPPRPARDPQTAARSALIAAPAPDMLWRTLSGAFGLPFRRRVHAPAEERNRPMSLHFAPRSTGNCRRLRCFAAVSNLLKRTAHGQQPNQSCT